MVAKNLKVVEKWGPAEWFGVDVFSAHRSVRLNLALDAKKPIEEASRACNFLSSLTGQAKTCSKAGGICSVQRYRRDSSGDIVGTGIKVAICPHRIISKTVLKEIVPKVLGTGIDAVLVKEVPYSVSLIKTLSSGQPAYAGRIDWLLVNPNAPEIFCAVETQSVYMSGTSQDQMFDSVIHSMGLLEMPEGHRHPDYKSSVPKRLGPQLESKARHLSATGRKTVVIVDEFVFENMHRVREIDVPEAFANDKALAEAHKLNGSEVIFAIVSIANGDVQLAHLFYCHIADATAAINAVAAMSKRAFEDVVHETVVPKRGRPNPAKVFAL